MDTVSATTLLELIIESPDADVCGLIDKGRIVLIGTIVNQDFHKLNCDSQLKGGAGGADQ